MNRFEYSQVQTIQEAIDMMTQTVPEATLKRTSGPAYVVKAGGTDLLDLIKEGIVEPDRVIDLHKITGLDKLSYDTKTGLQFGPMVTIADLEFSSEVRQHYRALWESCAHAATPQLRNMATMGGNLMQRPRCWYFRSSAHKCRKKGGVPCFARSGENQYHAIFENSLCPCVHASSIATALVAFDGKVELTGPKGARIVPLGEFFIPSSVKVTQETVAESHEIITNIMLPPVDANTRSAYFKMGERESYDWSLADVAVVLKMDGKTVKEARIVFGAAAPTPLRRSAAEEMLKGKAVNAKLAAAVAKKAVEGATPLRDNRYKVKLFENITKKIILDALM